MPINQLTSELSTVAGFNSQNILVVTTSTAVSTVPVVQIASTQTLTRKPATSTSTISSGVFTPDVPGLYIVTVVNGGLSFPLNIIAAPAALFNTSIGGPGQTMPTRNPFGLTALTNILTTSFGSWSAATFATSVEAATPTYPFGFHGGMLGGSAATQLPWSAYVAY